MASKDMKIMITADQVMYSNISKSKDGYNSARLVAKIADNEYMSVSYEWEGKNVPDFAMNLMGFMQANELEVGTVIEAHADDEYACKTCKEHNAKKKGKNPFVKDKDMEDEEEDPKKKKKTDKKKKEKSKKMCGGCGKTKAECKCDGGFMEEKKEKSGEGSQVHCKNCKKTKDKCDCGNWQPVPYKTKDQKENKTK